jgi:class III poly(R)-hydroxyalkanoic acid synthase PhaE subunit
MNWTDQAQAMMNTWTEAQKQLWEGWYDLARKGPGMTGMPNVSDPLSWLKQGMGAWTKESGDTSQWTAGNIFGSQANMMRSLELLTKAWQTVVPNLEAGKPWQPDLQSFLNQWTKQMTAVPERTMGAGKNVTDLWTSFLGEWGTVLKPWLSSFNQMGMAGHVGEMLLGGSSPLARMLTMREDMEPAFEGLAEIPTVGVAREQQAKILRAFDAFVDLRKSSVKYHAAMAKAIEQAVERTMQHLAGLAQKGEQITSVRELMRIWVRIADQAFTELYNAEEFTAVQKDMSQAALTYKLAQRDVLEMVFKSLDIPTRTEVDDAYRTLHNLKKEVRELRKALHAAQPKAALERPAEKATAEKAAPKRKAAAKS